MQNQKDGIALVPLDSFETGDVEQRDVSLATPSSGSKQLSVVSHNLNLRSQRISDTYPIHQYIVDRNSSFLSRFSKQFLANYVLQPLVNVLFPQVLHNNPVLQYLLFFRPTTQVKLLCSWTCDEGHICQHTEGHTGKHICVFGHVEGKPINKCPHICDCRNCDAECSFEQGHSGIHKCRFKHYWSDIPGNKRELEQFRDDKAIGDYIDELVYASNEELKFASIPETLDKSDELDQLE